MIDGITVQGGQIPVRPQGIVETFDDHRIQMTAIFWPQYVAELLRVQICTRWHGLVS